MWAQDTTYGAAFHEALRLMRTMQYSGRTRLKELLTRPTQMPRQKFKGVLVCTLGHLLIPSAQRELVGELIFVSAVCSILS